MKLTIKTPPSFAPVALHELPRAENDPELEWLFEHAESEINLQSNWHPLVEVALSGARRTRYGTSDAAERRADAMHRASTIVGWLEKLPAHHGSILVAAYKPRCWPGYYEMKFKRLSGVVAQLPSVLADHRTAHARGHTRTRDPVAWLDDDVRSNAGQRAGQALEEALVPYVRALAAYRAVRGTRPSLMEEGL
jgi:hypothetical protein